MDADLSLSPVHAPSRQEPGAAGPALGLYISIPFCRSKCTYCNFSSGVYPAREHARYVNRLIEDLAAAGGWAAELGAELPRRVDTVYLGGGTPSLLEPDLLALLFRAIGRQFELAEQAEITMECAPGQIAGSTLEAMAACGVNRVSLGVQSFVDSEARASGRLHNRAALEDDLRRLRAAGIANLNIDLIAGLAGQTFASWEASLESLAACEAPHASVYMLEVDEDSRLGRELLAGGLRYGAALVPADDAIARMYERAIDSLAAAGLAQYEISNFSRPGFESRHNLRYWQRKPYLGLGLDASSMLRALPGREWTDITGSELISGRKAAMKDERASAPGFTLRSATTGDLSAYLAGPQPPEFSWLSPDRQHEEAWFLGLRLNAGVDIAAMEREFGRARVAPALETAARLAADGLLEFKDKTARLTPRGRMLSNDVFQEFLAAEPAPAC